MKSKQVFSKFSQNCNLQSVENTSEISPQLTEGTFDYLFNTEGENYVQKEHFEGVVVA